MCLDSESPQLRFVWVPAFAGMTVRVAKDDGEGLALEMAVGFAKVSSCRLEPQFIIAPPFTFNACPVICAASSDAKKATALPISSGVCSRPKGIVCLI